jgi:hypothetical protein
MMRRSILALTLLALASARAAAADMVSEFENRPTALYAQMGLGTPIGFLGLEVERTVAPELAISAGAGFGETGPQFAAMMRPHYGGDRSKVVFGAGLSGGDYSWRELCYDELCAEKRGIVAWANFEIGGEHRFRNGFAMKYFWGYGRIVGGDLVCVGETADNCVRFYQDDGRQLLYTGFALGYAF